MSHPYRSWTRRDFLRLAGRAGLLGAFPTLASAAAALEPDTVCISILHTTDLHGHILPTSDYDGTADRGGLARCVTQIRRWRQAKSELDPGRCRRRLSRHRGEPPKQGRTDDRSFQSPQIRRVGDWQSRVRLGNASRLLMRCKNRQCRCWVRTQR